jgi:hypothetical protein
MKAMRIVMMSVCVMCCFGWFLNVMAAEKEAKEQENWLIKDVKATIPSTTDYEDDMKFSSPKGKMIHKIVPDKGNRLIIVNFQVTALVSDPQAIEKLAKKCEDADKLLQSYDIEGFGTYKILFGGVLLSAEEQKALTGQYRLFDIMDTVLIDSSGNRYTAVWIDYPDSREVLFDIMGEGLNLEWLIRPKDPEYWHQTLQFPKWFVGLLDIGQAVSVSLVYNLPSTVELDKLNLQFAGEKPVPVMYKEK